MYDTILSHGTEEVYENKENLARFKFFTAKGNFGSFKRIAGCARSKTAANYRKKPR
jgi:hypothetical protein